MKTITKEYKVYTYDELKGDAVDKATSSIYEILYENNAELLEGTLLDYMNDTYKINLDSKDLTYSLTNNQGDGVSFLLDNVITWAHLHDYLFKDSFPYNELNIFEKVVVKQLSKEDIDLVYEYVNSGYVISINRRNSRYAHPYTCYLDYEIYQNDNKELEDKVNSCISKLCGGLLKDKYNEVCKDLEEVGYTLLDVNQDDILDYIEINKIDFFENGDVAYL